MSTIYKGKSAIPRGDQEKIKLSLIFWPWKGVFQKKTNRGEGGEGKKTPPLDIPQNCVKSLGNFKAKNQNHCKSQIIFSWSPLEIRLRFYLTSENSTSCFFDTPRSSIFSKGKVANLKDPGFFFKKVCPQSPFFK